GPRGPDVEPRRLPDAAPHRRAAPRVPDDPGPCRRGVPPLRLDPPQHVPQLPRDADALGRAARPRRPHLRRPVDGRGRAHRDSRIRNPRRHQPGPHGPRRGARAAAADHDARRAVPLPARGRPQRLPAHELELRAARPAARRPARQAPPPGAVGRAGGRRVRGMGARQRHRPRPHRGARSRGARVTRASTAALADEFIRHIADGRQLSPHTVAAYRQDLAELRAFLDRYYDSESWTWGGVDRIALRAYLGHLANQGRARRTIARKLSAVRSFYRFLHREERVEANPARAIRSPNTERRRPAWLARGELARLFQAAETRAAENSFTGTRDLAILETFYATGMRLSELHLLDMADLDLVA